MFLRIDRLQTGLSAPKKADPNAAAALQELLGGKHGEMSTLGNYLFQSFNFRSKSKLRPFYSLVAGITAEDLGHVELVSNGVAMLNNGPDTKANEAGGADVIVYLPRNKAFSRSEIIWAQGKTIRSLNMGLYGLGRADNCSAAGVICADAIDRLAKSQRGKE